MNLARCRRVSWERLLSPFAGTAPAWHALALPWLVRAVTPGGGGHA